MPTTRSAPSPASRPKAPPRPKPSSPVLDLRLIRERPDEVQRALVQKGGAELIPEILARDVERRRLLKEVEDLRPSATPPPRRSAARRRPGRTPPPNRRGCARSATASRPSTPS